MTFNTTAESITILIGVITLIIGVINSIKSNRQNIKAQHIQIILTLSESFTQKWESSWDDVLDELNVDHINPRLEEIPAEHIKCIRSMLNWVDWLGAMKRSGIVDELDILTSSIGVAIMKIINAGHTIIKEDTQNYGKGYWKNLFIVADHLNAEKTIKLRDTCS